MQTAREIIVDESDFFESSDVPDSEKNTRLLFLFMKDLMTAANGQIMDAKDRRDREKRKQVTLGAKIAAWTGLFFFSAALLLYVYLFAIRQTDSRQSAWFQSFVVWLFFEIFIVSSVLVFLQQIFIPLLTMRDVQRVKKRVVNDIKSFKEKAKERTSSVFAIRRESQRKASLQVTANKLNAAKYFYASWRLAKLYPDLKESAMVANFSTPYPKKSLQRQDKGMSKVYGRKFRFIGQAVSKVAIYFIVQLVQLPPPVQDAIVQLIVASGLGYILVYVVKLYQYSPLLVLVPIVFLVIIVHFMTSSGKKKELMSSKERAALSDNKAVLVNAPKINPADDKGMEHDDFIGTKRVIRESINRIHPLPAVHEDESKLSEVPTEDLELGTAHRAILKEIRSSLNQIHPLTHVKEDSVHPTRFPAIDHEKAGVVSIVKMLEASPDKSREKKKNKRDIRHQRVAVKNKSEMFKEQRMMYSPSGLKKTKKDASRGPEKVSRSPLKSPSSKKIKPYAIAPSPDQFSDDASSEGPDEVALSDRSTRSNKSDVARFPLDIHDNARLESTAQWLLDERFASPRRFVMSDNGDEDEEASDSEVDGTGVPVVDVQEWKEKCENLSGKVSEIQLEAKKQIEDLHAKFQRMQQQFVETIRLKEIKLHAVPFADDVIESTVLRMATSRAEAEEQEKRRIINEEIRRQQALEVCIKYSKTFASTMLHKQVARFAGTDSVGASRNALPEGSSEWSADEWKNHYSSYAQLVAEEYNSAQRIVMDLQKKYRMLQNEVTQYQLAVSAPPALVPDENNADVSLATDVKAVEPPELATEVEENIESFSSSPIVPEPSPEPLSELLHVPDAPVLVVDAVDVREAPGEAVEGHDEELSDDESLLSLEKEGLAALASWGHALQTVDGNATGSFCEDGNSDEAAKTEADVDTVNGTLLQFCGASEHGLSDGDDKRVLSSPASPTEALTSDEPSALIPAVVMMCIGESAFDNVATLDAIIEDSPSHSPAINTTSQEGQPADSSVIEPRPSDHEVLNHYFELSSVLEADSLPFKSAAGLDVQSASPVGRMSPVEIEVVATAATQTSCKDVTAVDNSVIARQAWSGVSPDGAAVAPVLEPPVPAASAAAPKPCTTFLSMEVLLARAAASKPFTAGSPSRGASRRGSPTPPLHQHLHQHQHQQSAPSVSIEMLAARAAAASFEAQASRPPVITRAATAPSGSTSRPPMAPASNASDKPVIERAISIEALAARAAAVSARTDTVPIASTFTSKPVSLEVLLARAAASKPFTAGTPSPSPSRGASRRGSPTSPLHQHQHQQSAPSVSIEMLAARAAAASFEVEASRPPVIIRAATAPSGSTSRPPISTVSCAAILYSSDKAPDTPFVDGVVSIEALAARATFPSEMTPSSSTEDISPSESVLEPAPSTSSSVSVVQEATSPGSKTMVVEGLVLPVENTDGDVDEELDDTYTLENMIGEISTVMRTWHNDWND
jgi:hypothetical protein